MTTLEPDYNTWGEVLQANCSLEAALGVALGAQVRREARQELLVEASQHTKALHVLAQDLGISLAVPIPELNSRCAGPIIMSGHQPVLYHRGLLFKAEMLGRMASDSSGTGVHVVIDTDEGDGGAVVWPKITHGSLELRRASLVAESRVSGVTYGAQCLASADTIAALFDEIESDVRQSVSEEVAERVKRMRAVYVALANQPVCIAHAIARWSVQAPRYLEVPLSSIITKTHLRGVVDDLVHRGARLAEIYNTTLDEHRAEHRIENKANPFPNLKVTEAGSELPFWIVEAGIRKPVYVDKEHAPVCPSNAFYAPRGSMTTLLLRAYCSDMFIHGLGGKRYDTFVDRFAQRYWHVTLPKFVVASETRYLFPAQVEHITREVRIASQFKEILARTENFLGQGIFSEDEERALQSVLDSRQQLRVKMQQVRSDEERRLLAHALNDANRQVRELLEAGSLKTLRARAASNEAALSRLMFREFPFFMFDANQG